MQHASRDLRRCVRSPFRLRRSPRPPGHNAPLNRVATSPNTPGCQAGSWTTSAASSCQPWASTWATAASTVAFSTARRSALALSSTSAKALAWTGSRVSNMSTANVASSMRPRALMRGPRRKPQSVAVTWSGRRLDTWQSAANPGRAAWAIRRKPAATKIRLVCCMGTMSATVATATRSNRLRTSGSGLWRKIPASRQARRKATTSKNATPAAHMPLKG